MLLIGALAALPTKYIREVSRTTLWLAACFICAGVLSTMDWGSPWALKQFDRPSKYLLVLPCLFFLTVHPPRQAWMAMGIATGATGAGLIALVQVYVQHLGRATGYTNAIEYGNISLLLGAMSLVLLCLQWPAWRYWQRALLLLGCALGVVGSVLSQTRGGWLALLLMLPFGLWASLPRRALPRVTTAFAGVLLVLVMASQTAVVQQRIELAWQETQAYVEGGDKDNSVGLRLGLWRTAWQLGMQRPLLGWGSRGFDAEISRRVTAGEIPASMLNLHHAHNEVLNAFVKHGLVGVLLLLVFYLGPLALFWPLDSRVKTREGETDVASLALCIVGILLPLSYIGFGLTQVFLAHNSGNMFYLFMCSIALATLEGRRHECTAQSTETSR